MQTLSPAFVTNREVDLFLGGGERGPRKRQRLRNAMLLPWPAELGRVRRHNIAVFPRFALVGLMNEFGQLPGAAQCLRALTQSAFGMAAFTQLAEAVLSSAREMDTWRFDLLVDNVLERAEPAVYQWNACVDAAERELQARYDIGFSTALGAVERAASGICVVSLDAGGTERFPLERVAIPVEKGRAVAIERVRVMGTEMNFVMPSTTNIADTEDRALAAWFKEAMMPTTEPVTVATSDESTAEHLPYSRRSARRQAHWRGASTMTRVPAAR
jgi:hypothetical protein